MVNILSHVYWMTEVPDTKRVTLSGFVGGREGSSQCRPFCRGDKSESEKGPFRVPLSVSLPTGALPFPTVFGLHPLSAPAWVRAGTCFSEGSAQVAMAKVNVGLKTFLFFFRHKTLLPTQMTLRTFLLWPERALFP